jgi:peptidoglycan/xylan/chitin deacetylase (PgdA/CDA1 family)
MITLNLLFPVHWIFYLLLILVYSLILFYGSSYIRSNFYIRVLCNADTTKREIAISFDDGPADINTDQLLRILTEHKTPATFFCIGKNIKGRESVLQSMMAAGHIIGNHSYSHHFWFDLLSTAKMSADLAEMDKEMFRATGYLPKLFRPPYGVTNPNLAKAITGGGYTPVGWNIRSLDTVITSEKKLLARVLNSVKPGSIVLFHDTGKATISILPAFIEKVKSRGYEIVGLDKLLNITPYA